MLRFSLVFLVVALIAAFLGFGGIAGTAAGIAKILFVQMFVPLMLFRKMNLVLFTQQIPKDVLAVPIV